MMRRFLGMLLVPATAWAFSFELPGDLVRGSGTGQPASTLEVADMRFPLEDSPAFANSQVHGVGGSQGPAGSQCAAANYSYPWRDNFCESRTWPMPLCPAGTGHQGQDIRPATCADNTHWVVATENGTITSTSGYAVYLQGTSGVRHRFLHMDMANLAVSTGQYVTKGQRLGKVSNDFGGTPTTIHLHYDMHRYVAGVGSVYVSPYMSLVNSYELMLGLTPTEDPFQTCPQAPVAGAENERFHDVPPWVTGAEHIEALANAAITTGCAPDLFCPECDTERYMMAVFIARAAGLDLTNPPSTPSFTDVPASAWYYPHVEAVKAAGIVSGCTSTTFCPENTLTRKEAAKFLTLGAGLPLVNPSTPTFQDVPIGDWGYTHVETLAEHCVTVGCAPGQFCPNHLVSRRIAAIFIARAFDLDDLNSCISTCDASTCDGGSFCEDYGTCGGFSNTCDETGTQSRTCHDFACTGSAIQGSCSETTRTESRSCTRDTDGTVVEGWGSWGSCAVSDPACGGTGSQARTRAVCAGGSQTTASESRSCTVGPTEDDDGDGVCDRLDVCAGNDATGDGDDDGVCDDLDVCVGDDATGDVDADGVCGDQDVCAGDDATGDGDDDGVCDDLDVCVGDDGLDADLDGVPDACDQCVGDDATGDGDVDGVCDDLDLCVGDDRLDADADGVPDACDLCFGVDGYPDLDADGLCEPTLSMSELVIGQTVELRVEGAPPGATVVFARSRRPPGNTCVLGGSVCLGLVRPSVMATATADSEGTAVVSRVVPDTLPVGLELRFQAVWRLGGQAEASSQVLVRTVASP
jgi:hypothetical protein